MVIALIIVLGVIVCWYGYLFLEIYREKSAKKNSLAVDNLPLNDSAHKSVNKKRIVYILNMITNITVREQIIDTDIFFDGGGSKIIIVACAPKPFSYDNAELCVEIIRDMVHMFFDLDFACPPNFGNAYKNALRLLLNDPVKTEAEKQKSVDLLKKAWLRWPLYLSDEERIFCYSIDFEAQLYNKDGKVYNKIFHIGPGTLWRENSHPNTTVDDWRKIFR